MEAGQRDSCEVPEKDHAGDGIGKNKLNEKRPAPEQCDCALDRSFLLTYRQCIYAIERDGLY